MISKTEIRIQILNKKQEILSLNVVKHKLKIEKRNINLSKGPIKKKKSLTPKPTCTPKQIPKEIPKHIHEPQISTGVVNSLEMDLQISKNEIKKYKK